MGIHRCAGAHIGRAIAHELIRQVITRMPDYVVDEDGLEAYPHQGVNAGFQRIPTTFTPGRRLGP
jgi:cytochrome P450